MSEWHVEGIIVPVETAQVHLLIMEVLECIADALICFNVTLHIGVICGWYQCFLVHLELVTSMLWVSCNGICNCSFSWVSIAHFQIGSVHYSSHLLKVLEVLKSEVSQVAAYFTWIADLACVSVDLVGELGLAFGLDEGTVVILTVYHVILVLHVHFVRPSVRLDKVSCFFDVLFKLARLVLLLHSFVGGCFAQPWEVLWSNVVRVFKIVSAQFLSWVQWKVLTCVSTLFDVRTSSYDRLEWTLLAPVLHVPEIDVGIWALVECKVVKHLRLSQSHFLQFRCHCWWTASNFDSCLDWFS